MNTAASECGSEPGVHRADGHSPRVGARAFGAAKMTHTTALSDPAGIDAVEPLADSTARQARRLVAANADDAEECRAFLSMLGIGLAKLVEA